MQRYIIYFTIPKYLIKIYHLFLNCKKKDYLCDHVKLKFKMDLTNFKENVPIETVIGHYINLKRSAANYVACCPFHNEKTPSFHVTPSKGMYKCFGCGVSGDAIEFVKEHEKVSFVEAIRLIAEITGVEPPKLDIDKDANSTSYKVNEWALKSYQKNLTQEHYDYFAKRKISKEIVNKFEVGYAPGTFQFLSKIPSSKHQPLIDLGLLIKNENGNTYDRFRNRIMFAWKSASNKIIGFSGRTLSSDTKQAKYINSTDSAIFTKGENFFGMSLAKKAILKTDEALIVEGQIDCMTFHEIGFENVLATSGTAFTEKHAIKLKSLIGNSDIARVILFFDSDEAGEKSSEKTTMLLLAQNINIKVCFFPNGDDPNSYYCKVGKDSFVEYVKNNSMYFSDYAIQKIERLKEADQKNQAIRKLIEVIGYTHDMVKRNLYFSQIASSLSHYGLTFEIINEISNEIKSGKTIQKKTYTKVKSVTQSLSQAETELIVLYLLYGEEVIGNNNNTPIAYENKVRRLANYFFEELYDAEHLLNETFRIFYFVLKYNAETGTTFSQSDLIALKNKELENLVKDSITYPKQEFSQKIIDKMYTAIISLKLQILQEIFMSISDKLLKENDELTQKLLNIQHNETSLLIKQFENILND